MARTRERKTVTLCALETAQCFDAVTAWVVCVIAERIEVLSGGLGVDVVLETAGHLTRSVGHCEAQRKPGRFYVAAEHSIVHMEGILRNTGIFSHICGREAAEFLCTYN